MITTYARIGRAVTAAVIATSYGTLALGWFRRRRAEPVPVVRCPIHGIAYDTELEPCGHVLHRSAGVEWPIREAA